MKKAFYASMSVLLAIAALTLTGCIHPPDSNDLPGSPIQLKLSECSAGGFGIINDAPCLSE